MIARNASQKLVLDKEDVTALLRLPELEILVMSMAQAVADIDGQRKDFEWLQRVLRRRESSCNSYKPIRVTTNELAYRLEPLEVFQLKLLKLDDLKESSDY